MVQTQAASGRRTAGAGRLCARACCAASGRPPEARAALIEGTGLDEVALSAAGIGGAGRSALLAFVANLTRIHGPTWPVDAADLWAAPLQGALDVAIRSAATAEAALRVVARYGRARAPYLAFRLQSGARARRVVITRDAPMDGAVWRATAEAVALSINAVFAQVLEDGFRRAAIDFPWSAPPHAAGLRGLFACELRFDRPDFAFEAPAALCPHVSPYADPALHRSALAELEAAARRIDGAASVGREVERMIEAALPRRLGAAEAARRLGLSRRTLVRRLAAEDAAYGALLDGVLRERARSLLAAGALSRDHAAEALGYADPTSFSRACRRWFGGA